MGRPGRAVYKFDEQGKQLDKYISVNKAARENNMTTSGLNYYIAQGKAYKGFRYSFGEKMPAAPDGEKKEYPWEKNGFFDVRGWAEVCL